DPECTGARKHDRDRSSPPSLVNIAADDTLRSQLPDRLLNIVAHEIKLLELFLGRMDRQLRRRQCKNEPSATRIDGTKAEHIAKERPVLFGVFRINKRMDSGDHRGWERKILPLLCRDPEGNDNPLTAPRW